MEEKTKDNQILRNGFNQVYNFLLTIFHIKRKLLLKNKMVNEELLEYFRSHAWRHSAKDLKKKATEYNYSEDEINEVIRILGLEEDLVENEDLSISSKTKKIWKRLAGLSIVALIGTIIFGIILILLF